MHDQIVELKPYNGPLPAFTISPDSGHSVWLVMSDAAAPRYDRGNLAVKDPQGRIFLTVKEGTKQRLEAMAA